MKRLLAAALIALSTASFSATLTPVQLLNPAGSVAGQAIVSTGTTTAPAWGGVGLNGITPIAANTVLANVTASSAAPAAVSLPSCSTANSALKYTSAAGFSCGTTFALTTGNLSQFSTTTSAQLANIVSDETGSGSLVFGASPTVSTPNLVGVTGGANALTGSYGEYGSATATAANIANNTSTSNGSLTLAAGDYNVWVYGVITCTANSVGGATVGFSTTANTLGAAGTYSFINGTSLGSMSLTTPPQRVLISASTTYFATANVVFSSGTCTFASTFYWRRIR